MIYYFDSFGLDPPEEIRNYLKGSPEDLPEDSKGFELSTFQILEFGTHHCGYYLQFSFTDSVLSLLIHNFHKPEPNCILFLSNNYCLYNRLLLILSSQHFSLFLYSS
uniref:Uncharacterized protein n=1 Tax=Heterorhabditis bacteriophora TaxID=37862 RepID=A0A1I7WIF9_HETBA